MAEKTPVVEIGHPHYRKKTDSLKETKAESKYLEHLKYCFTVCSLHGVKHIVWPNRSVLERILWTGAVVYFATFGLLKGYDVYRHYLVRPSVIGVETDYRNWQNEFPSFTLCQKALDDSVLEMFNTTKDSEVYQYLNDLAFGNYLNYHLYEKYANGSKKEFLKPEQYLNVLWQIVPTITPGANSKDKDIVFPFDEDRPLLKIATELGICLTLNPLNGIYYTPDHFNSTEPYDYKPIVYGYRFSIVKFELRSFSNEYRVALHSPKEIIAIDTNMFDFGVTTVTIFTTSTLSVWTSKFVTDLTIEQRNCRLFDEAEGLEHSPVYTYNLCQIECRIKLCLKFCNCTPYYYRRNDGEKVCDMAGMYCLSKYTPELMELYDRVEDKSLCSCYQNCFYTMVVIESASSISWFSDTRLTIQILDHPSIRYVRQLIFSKIDLFVQIGGILSLCLGCTVPGIIEIFYFTTLRFYWGVIRGMAIKKRP